MVAWCLTVLFLSLNMSSAFCTDLSDIKILKEFVSSISIDRLGNAEADIKYADVGNNVIKVQIWFTLTDTVRQDDWRIRVKPAFIPAFHWSPHLTPTDSHIIAQHVFRAPAMIVANDVKQITLVPDLDLMMKGSDVDWYMDLDAPKNILTLGMSNSTVGEHVLFTKDLGAVYLPGRIEFGFYILVNNNTHELFNPWDQALRFLWANWGQSAYKSADKPDLSPYVKNTYNWAFKNWEESVWQKFQVSGKEVGAPTFIVNVTQSPNYQGLINEREFRSVWNQAWFSSLRSAQGLFRYASKTRDKRLMNKAQLTKELALSFPKKNGFFHGLIATEMEEVEVKGVRYHRSKGWDTYYWGNSNRNPYTHDARVSPYHILDMSYTAWLMLNWYEELEKDERLLDYATSYADALLDIQDTDGFFPAWLALDDLKPYDILAQSPETSMSVTFLIKLSQLKDNKKYLNAALKAMDAIAEDIIMEGRWEDFETYWSCSSYGKDHLVGLKEKRNNMHKQNTLSMYWTAEALLNAYHATSKIEYLHYGKRTLDELLMAQAIWQPPFIHVDAFGGFGVMNADGEWNDSRQSLFAESIVRYGKELGNQEYVERGLAALRASFNMMYSPDNTKTEKQWKLKWPFFGKEDYGFMMENYGHEGVTDDHGLGIGEFTIYDWGNGAAAEAYSRMVDHYGIEFITTN